MIVLYFSRYINNNVFRGSIVAEVQYLGHFHDVGGAVMGRGKTFRDMGDAVLGVGYINFETWEVLFRDMGGAELGGGRQEQILSKDWWPSG